MNAMIAEFISSINDIDADSWQRLWNTDYPFIQHSFLQALEESQCVCVDSGWEVQHLLVWNDSKTQLLAAMPLYLKSHSYGEYVFDWAWADAYQRYGREYYPKLLNAIPFTPATGPRLAIDEKEDRELLTQFIIDHLQTTAKDINASSCHFLFPDTVTKAQLQPQAGLLLRDAVQFHWFNRGYKNFDEFLETFKSRKRKNLRNERLKVAGQGIELRQVEGPDITEEQWHRFYHFYHMTYLKRSGRQGYLNKEFFQQLAKNCSESIMMVQAFNGEEMVAGALYFKDQKNLYGRYWGCLEEFDMLHFEACYYQGIEYAIQNGLARFDPGAQGEHKIQRGFEPSFVYSLHWISDSELSPAIAGFLEQERQQVHEYHRDAGTYLPFKSDDKS